MNDEPELRTASSEAEAKAQLESDVARLESTLNAERFCIAVAVTVLFDAFMFRDYKVWSAPVALLVVELTGLFVLARRLKVDEVVGLTFEVLKSWGKSRESDPK